MPRDSNLLKESLLKKCMFEEECINNAYKLPENV
jgi:hypothetical protein